MSAESYIACLPLALVACDGENCVTFLNPLAEEWLGISQRQAEGQSFFDLLPPNETMQRLMMQATSSGMRISAFECDILLADGSRHTSNIHLSPLDGGAWMWLFKLIPESLLPSRSSMQQEARRIAGLMAAMLAHEVKNPLAGIRGAAQLLKDELPEESRPLAEIICSEVDRVAGVLSRMEPFSETEKPEGRALNVHEVLRYASSVAKAGFAQAVSFHEDYDPSLPEVLAVRDLLTQLLINLMKNAAEAGAENIRLHTAYSFEPATPVALVVEDDGPGIETRIQPYLFEPFTSSKGGRRGLGLAICAKIAADMGGKLLLDKSIPGCTRFRVLLKMAGQGEASGLRARDVDDDVRELA